jgi:GalNAc-alpha-(1->4)-GalNAc-alpha-(1->3)-diNAcBac-PP-undecaprenol alpha-1,4-N-acetyl-D-galactosaminyltransferase
MKIDFLINQMGPGGAERVVSLIANYLDNQGHEIRIITFQGPDCYTLNDTVTRVKLHRHPFFRSVVFNGFFGMLKYYRDSKNRPDIMSSHIDLLAYMTIPIAKIFRLKIVVSEHNNHLLNNSMAKKLMRKYLYPLADAVTILTNFDASYFLKKNDHVVVMPNPCTLPIQMNQSVKKENSKEIIAIGGLNRFHIKGFDNLIQIASEIFKKNPDWTLKIVGEGQIGMDYLKRETQKLGIENNVIFTGFRKDIQELLSKAEIFILCSRTEGMPMALLEAMSQGVPCIAYDCPSGPSDIITHNLNGLLIENQRKEEMISGLHELINNRELRKKFRSNAPQALEQFSLKSVGTKWEELLLFLEQN